MRNRVRSIWILSLPLIGFGALLFSIPHSLPPPTPSTTDLPLPKKDIRYSVYTLPQSVVHTLLIPIQSHFLVTPALAQKVDTLQGFAQKQQAVAVLNGGFFDPQNQKSTSYVVLQGELVADPRLNERLMNNPGLAPYLEQILNRTELRQYLCGKIVRYDIVLHKAPSLVGCQLVAALGGGPRLLPELTSVPEGFLDYVNGRMIRDPLRSSQPDTRTAIGITHDGSILWVMVAQKPEALPTSGMSLQALAAFMKTLGVVEAMNLDGGSSSSLYYQGKTHYGKVNEAGNLVRRPVKSVLIVR